MMFTDMDRLFLAESFEAPMGIRRRVESRANNNKKTDGRAGGRGWAERARDWQMAAADDHHKHNTVGERPTQTNLDETLESD
jgi:hypothetical protein